MTQCRAVLFDFFGTLTRAVARGRAHQNIARWLGCDPRAFTAELNQTFLVRARGGYGPAARPPRRTWRGTGSSTASRGGRDRPPVPSQKRSGPWPTDRSSRLTGERRRRLTRGVQMPHEFADLIGRRRVPVSPYPVLDDLPHQRGRADPPRCGRRLDLRL